MISMSAIDFYCSVDKVKGVDGKDRVVLTFDGKYLPHSEQVSIPSHNALMNPFSRKNLKCDKKGETIASKMQYTFGFEL